MMASPSVSASVRWSACSAPTTAAAIVAAMTTAATAAAEPPHDRLSQAPRSSAHMTNQRTHRTAIALTGALLLGTALLVAPARSSAQTAAAPPLAAKAASATQAADARVEARIKTLHKQFGITAAQEQQWAVFAQVMRDNAASMSKKIADREAAASKTNAVDDLKSYESLAEAHADNVKKLIPPFETLYGTMSDAQKKQADTVFDQPHHRAPAKKKSS
jgi:protein CpxP